MRQLIVLLLLSFAGNAGATCRVEGVTTTRVIALLDLLNLHPEIARRGGIDPASLRSHVASGVQSDQIQALFEPGGLLSYRTILQLRRANREAFRTARDSHDDAEGVVAIFEASFPVMQDLETSGCTGSLRAAGVSTNAGASCASAPADRDAAEELGAHLEGYDRDRMTALSASRDRIVTPARRSALDAEVEIHRPGGTPSADGWRTSLTAYVRERAALNRAYSHVCETAYPGPTRLHSSCESSAGHPRTLPQAILNMATTNESVLQTITEWNDQRSVSDALYNLSAGLRAVHVAEALRGARSRADVVSALNDYDAASLHHPAGAHQRAQQLLLTTSAAIETCERAASAAAEAATSGGGDASGD